VEETAFLYFSKGKDAEKHRDAERDNSAEEHRCFFDGQFEGNVKKM